MKFSSGIDGLLKENSFLRKLVLALVVLSGALAGTALTLFERKPLIIERSSRGLEIVNQTAAHRTEGDLRAAIKLMIQARFASDALSPELFLNKKQLALKDVEQKDMVAKGMTQAVVVKIISVSDDKVIVDFDRVLSVGELRSALKTRIKIAFEDISPNELNPYGLLLSLADPVLEKGG